MRTPARLIFAGWVASFVNVFAAGPISSFQAPYSTVGSIERLDPALDVLIAAEAKLEKLAEGFNWSEGPVWLPDQKVLLFSDVPENVVYRWQEGKGVSVHLEPSGFTGKDYKGRERGSNGLTLDREGRVLLAQHGDRRVARLGKDGKSFETIADRFEGKRFNSPNDLCVDRRGRVFFTDPPYGLASPADSELGFFGVYRVDTDGTVTLVTKELERPNGIALSPDERTLYIANSHGPRPIIYAVDISGDKAGEGRVFFDCKPLMGSGRRGVPDGLRVDADGNLWATGPGGVLVISPAGKHLGTLLTGQATANCTFGEDGSTLFITADSQLLRVRTHARAKR
jgi:gluconolactonase